MGAAFDSWKNLEGNALTIAYLEKYAAWMETSIREKILQWSMPVYDIPRLRF